jgi:hypothetical protein
MMGCACGPATWEAGEEESLELSLGVHGQPKQHTKTLSQKKKKKKQ